MSFRPFRFKWKPVLTPPPQGSPRNPADGESPELPDVWAASCPRRAVSDEPMRGAAAEGQTATSAWVSPYIHHGSCPEIPKCPLVSCAERNNSELLPASGPCSGQIQEHCCQEAAQPILGDTG